MANHKITFLPHETKIAVPDGETIIHAAMEAGVHVNASCGGEGVCGKCRVRIEEGTVEGGINEKISQEDQDKGFRLACQSAVKSDLSVRIPVESAMDASVLRTHMTPRKTAHIREMNFDELKEKGLFVAPVEKKFLQLPEPTLQDNLSDITRLISYLKAQHDEHRLDVALSVIRKIPEVIREKVGEVPGLARVVDQTVESRPDQRPVVQSLDELPAVVLDAGAGCTVEMQKGEGRGCGADGDGEDADEEDQ